MAAALDPDRSQWDVVVIGGGPPGENAAQYATEHGLSAVIVESDLLGGECSYWACMPSKGLLRPIELLNTARAVAGARSVVGEHPVDVAAVLAHRDEIVHGLDDGSQVQWATGAGIDVVRGHGRLTGPRTVAVDTPGGARRELSATHAVVLATGSRPTVPPVDGLAAAAPWTSRDVTNLHEIPRRVLILGGGVVACEAATWLRGLGVEQLTVVQGSDRLLGRTEPFAGELVEQGLRDAGIGVALQTRVAAVARPHVTDGGVGRVHGGPVTVTLSDGRQLTVDEVVVAAGRTPNSDDVGLETVGARPGGFVEVDDQLTVAGVEGDWLYAVGDVCGRALLTHMGKYQARLAGDIIAARAAGRELDVVGFGRHVDLADHGAVPQVTFTDPEVGSVGLTEADARAAGHQIETVEFDLAAVAGSYLSREDYRGRAKLVLDADSDTLLGATFVGAAVAELVHSATVAVVGRVPVAALWHAVPSYPTISEVWLRLLETLRAQRNG